MPKKRKPAKKKHKVKKRRSKMRIGDESSRAERVSEEYQA